MSRERFGGWGLGVLLAAGLVLSAYVLGQALLDFKAAERYVTVKGLAVKEIPADMALWPVCISVTGNDLGPVHDQLSSSREQVISFLQDKGFDPSEISRSAPQIQDFQAQGYARQDAPVYRYQAKDVLMVRSGKVEQVKEAMADSGALAASGVALVQDYQYQPRFEFTGLNEVKPEMIARATENARQAARQFARDSGSKVGNIKWARQGLFTIQDQDAYTPEIKRVRVVTTVAYYLND
ncbi:MAG: SIMPL domain-containing protein [Desulfonatronovibrionaceae bacterium]